MPSTDERETVRRNVRAFREAVDMTQQEVAEAAGISAASLYRYEAGKSLPDRDALRALASVFGRAVDDFFEDKPPAPDPSRQKYFAFKQLGPVDDDLRRRALDEIAKLNREQQERARAAKEKGRRGKKL